MQRMEWLMLTLLIITVGFIGISSGLKCLACDSATDKGCINPGNGSGGTNYSKQCGSPGSKFPIPFDELKALFPVFESVLKDILGEKIWADLGPYFEKGMKLVQEIFDKLASIIGGDSGKEPMCMMASSSNGTIRGCSEDLPKAKDPKARGRAADTGICKIGEKGKKGCACPGTDCNAQAIGEKMTTVSITFLLGMTILLTQIITTNNLLF